MKKIDFKTLVKPFESFPMAEELLLGCIARFIAGLKKRREGQMDKNKFFLIGLAIIGFFWFQSLAFGQESLGLSDLQHTLKMRGARWQAGENFMTRLSPEERLKRLGLVRPVHTGREPMLSLEAQAPIVQLPANLDWRNSGGNYVTPIRDQGNCGSCWAFATTAALESATLISDHTPNTDLNLAEQVLVSCGGAGSCNGGSIDKASNFIKNTGLPGDGCYPYTATNGVCSSACSNWQASADRISSWSYVATTQATVDGIKNALSTYGPLVTTMAVYQDFFSYHSGIYHYVTGSLAGYHAVLIIGYDDVSQYFVVKNSWGTWWGESGFFRIAYSELNSPVGFGDWTIAYVGMGPACSYSLSQPAPFTAAGGSGTINVTTTASNCSWTATTSTSWITIPSAGASGMGNGTVTFNVTANTGVARIGSINIAGKSVNISQDAGAACAYTLNPTQHSFEASGESSSVGVTTGNGCAWSASSNATWIKIGSVVGPFGNGTVFYSVDPNSSPNPRTGTITIAGQTFYVTQAGAAGVPAISVSPTSINFGYVFSSASTTVKVTNKGNGRLNINSVSLSGSYASQFKINNSCTSLDPGASCNITVTFAPTSLGSKSANLMIYSNDPVKNLASVYLTGYGLRYYYYGR
jgi:hypothetical protein